MSSADGVITLSGTKVAVDLKTQPNQADRYTLSAVKGNSFYDYSRRLEFDILEDGIAIARVTRKARTMYGQWIPSMDFKFYTDASRYRFQDCCDSISMEEACEALYTAIEGK